MQTTRAMKNVAMKLAYVGLATDVVSLRRTLQKFERSKARLLAMKQEQKLNDDDRLDSATRSAAQMMSRLAFTKREARSLHLLRMFRKGVPYSKVENGLRETTLRPERVLYDSFGASMSYKDFQKFIMWTQMEPESGEAAMMGEDQPEMIIPVADEVAIAAADADPVEILDGDWRRGDVV